MKCHTHSLQSNIRHHKEEIQNTNRDMTARRQVKLSNQLSPPQRDDCKIRKDKPVLHTRTPV